MNRKYLLLLLSATLLLSSCSKDVDPEIKMDPLDLQMKYDGEHQFVVRNGDKVVRDNAMTWASSDSTVGVISANGQLKGRKIGSTVVKATLNGKDYLSWVTITPYSTMFREPEFEFGMAKSTLKTKSLGFLTQETDNFLIFNAANENIEKIIYLFEQDKLIAVAIDFIESESVKKEVATFYKERYPLTATTDKNEIIYINDEKSKAIYLNRSESLGFNVTYGQVIVQGGRLSADLNSTISILRK